jgi:hypothetical protein
MSVLSREEIRAMCAAQPPLVEGIDADVQIQTNGIDLRVERIQRLSSPGLLGASDALREPTCSRTRTDGGICTEARMSSPTVKR